MVTGSTKPSLTIEGLSYESGIDELTVLGVYIEAIMISDEPNAMGISATAISTYESLKRKSDINEHM
ncbi:MAG: hypothetical protein ACFFCW_44475 [Candidatus Hodarchaeota archaeon]